VRKWIEGMGVGRVWAAFSQQVFREQLVLLTSNKEFSL